MTWMRNCWQVAAFGQELAPPFLARTICDTAVLMWRSQDGTIAAIEDLCPHRLVPLSAGARHGDEIVCGYHGMRFGADGKCTAIPGGKAIAAASRRRAFPIVEQWDMVWIWLGEPSAADPSLVPDLCWLSDPKWRSVRGYVHMAADYRLITDNLLDLSHESFVHPSSIGNGSREVIADFPVTVRAGERIAVAERIMRDIETPPAFVAMMGLGGRIDRRQCATYMAPCFNLTETNMRDCGRLPALECRQRVLHLLTSESEKSTHYFFIASRDFGLDNPHIDDITERVSYQVFGEDQRILELQQRSLDRRPDAPLPGVAWSVDEAPVKARRLLDALIRAEQANPETVSRPVSLIAC